MIRTAITGIGAVSALGTGPDFPSAAVMRGHPALTAGTDPEHPEARLTGAIRDFSAASYLKTRKAYLDRTSELTLAAAALALADAGLDTAPRATGDIGLLFGSAYGNMATMALFYNDVLERGPSAAKPILFPHLYHNTAAGLAAMEFDLGGMHAVFAAGWPAGAAALAQGADWIGGGQANALLAGGADALHPLILEELQCAGRLSPLAGTAGGREGVFCFDARANGIVAGEGAAFLALESEERATGRGAGIMAELAGGAAGTADASAEVMRQALRRAGVGAAGLAWVCAHGSGDPAMDAWEIRALRELAAERGRRLPVWTPAPLMGETMAAGGVLRLALTVRFFREGRLPAYGGGTDTRPENAGLDFAAAARALPPGPVLINTFDPGGTLVSLVVKPWQ